MLDRNPTTIAIGVDRPTPVAVDIVTTLATALATSIAPSATFASSAQPRPPSHEPEGECRLLGSFALLVQAALGGLALLVLVYKRWRERPQRPVKIWFFDASKQVFGSVLVHIANIFMSMLTSGRFNIKPGLVAVSARGLAARDDFMPNPCSFYLLNLGIDTTLGIPILIVLLRVITYVVSFTPLGKPAESIQSGYYGNPPNACWWLKQSVIYFAGLFCMKICVLIIFVVMPWISIVGDWALRWTEGNEELQIAFVMMIFPLIMNGLQYYIIDSYIKKKVPEDDDDNDGNDGRGHFDRLLSAPDDAFDSDGEVDEEARKPRRVSQDADYDPEQDGDSRTAVGSSSNSSHFAKDAPTTSVKTS